MRKIILMIFVLLLGSLQASPQYAVVVSKKSNLPQLTRKQIKDLFLMKRHFIGDVKVIPVNVTSTQALRKAFEEKILQIQREQLNQYWVKKHFQGINPPVTQSSENSIKLFVKNVDGAIGYLPIHKIDDELKVLYEF